MLIVAYQCPIFFVGCQAAADGAQTASTTGPQQSHEPLGGRDNRPRAIFYRARRGWNVLVGLRLVLLPGNKTRVGGVDSISGDVNVD